MTLLFVPRRDQYALKQKIEVEARDSWNVIDIKGGIKEFSLIPRDRV